MSYLSLPRIGFFSTDGTVNVSTANNQNVENLLDYDNVVLKLPPREQSEPYHERDWWISRVTVDMPQPVGPQANLRGYWNYFGNHAINFGNARVNSLWLNHGAPITTGTDPLLGTHIVFNGRMIDLDPADTFCSWIISTSFKVIGVDATGEPITLLSGTNPTLAYTRWLNFNRYYGAGTFQFVVPRERLTFNNSVDSAALGVFEQKVRDEGAGIVVRYNLHSFKVDSKMTTDYMHEQFKQGNFVMNPKIGRVLGSIDVWYSEDMQSMPIGRLLYVPTSSYCKESQQLLATSALLANWPQVRSHGNLDHLAQAREKPSASLGAAEDDAGPCAVQDPPGMGPAVALVDPQSRVVTLDLLTTFPECTNSPKKIELGPVSLWLRYTNAQGQKQEERIGPVPYDQQIYEAQAGAVEVSYADKSGLDAYIHDGLFLLYRDTDGTASDATRTPLLQEIETVQIETDDRAVYFHQGQSREITLQVFNKGQPIQIPITLQLEQWQDFNVPTEETPGDPYPITNNPYFCFRQLQPGDPAYAISPSIDVPAGGKVKLTVTPNRPGCFKLRFIPPDITITNVPQQGCPQDCANGPDFTTEFFSNFRVLPHGDYSGYTDDQITWSFLYKEVFEYYALLYPYMSRIIPWGPKDAPDNPERVQEFAALIKQYVSEEALDSPMYMPITRELSAGKRALILRWCDLQLRDKG